MVLLSFKEQTMRVIQIAAMAGNRTIGNNNELPWHIPKDFKFFKDQTMGKILIMGRKTYESIPPSGLPNRKLVIVTRNLDYRPKERDDAVVVTSIAEAYKYCETQTDKFGDEVWIAGGAEIYKQTLAHTDLIILTEIEKEYEGDAFFPEFDKDKFELVKKQVHSEPENFSFCWYQKK